MGVFITDDVLCPMHVVLNFSLQKMIQKTELDGDKFLKVYDACIYMHESYIVLQVDPGHCTPLQVPRCMFVFFFFTFSF